MSKILKIENEIILSGTPISNGSVEGGALIFFLEPETTRYAPIINHQEIPEQIARMRQAFQLMLVIIEYSETFLDANVEDRHSNIFSMQKVLLEESAFRERIITVIKENRFRAQTAIAKVVAEYIRRLSGSQSELIRERASDLIDLKIGLIDALDRPIVLLQNSGLTGRNAPPSGHISVTRELTPRFVIEQIREGAKGILAEHGGKTSHAAILCRALAIPAVSEIKGVRHLIKDGTTLLLDGTLGRVVIFPGPDASNAIPSPGANAGPIIHFPRPAETKTAIRFMANISFAGNAADALADGIEGIGMYRTEFEFMIAGRSLDENEQFDLYRKVVETMAGRPVYIRLLDIQEDKPFPELGKHADSGSPLPIYGARFLLNNEPIVAMQSRAIARASRFGPIHVIYPMILDLNQFLEIKALFNRSLSGVEAGELKHGVMLEVPSACLQAHEILQQADFGCIGSNDLVKYLFGLDRNHDGELIRTVSRHPIFHEMITGIVQGAEKTGKTLLFCGDMASRLENLGWLASCGIKIISAPPEAILTLRKAGGNQ